MSAAIVITIDALDAADCPDAPFTLNTTAQDAIGVPSHEPAEYDDGSSCIVGSSVAELLRKLADEFEAGTVEHYGEPLTIEVGA